MTSYEEVNSYLARREIPQLFESMMVGLMFHRPGDHIQFLQQCLSKIRTGEVKRCYWNSFISRLHPRLRTLQPLSSCSQNNLYEVSEQGVSLSRMNKVPRKDSAFGKALTSFTNDVNRYSDDLHKETCYSGAPLDFSVIFILGVAHSEIEDLCREVSDKQDTIIHVSAYSILKRQTTVEDFSNITLVPCCSVIDQLQNRLVACKENRVVLITGFPRNKSDILECESQQCLKSVIRGVISLDFEEEYLRKILQTDIDSGLLQAVDAELQRFEEKMFPVIEYYENQGTFVRINCTTQRDDNISSLISAIKSLSSQEIQRKIDKSIVENKTDVQDSSSSHVEKESLGSRHFEEFKKPIIFVIGGPGSGKGTQCVKISEKYGFVHLATGDLLRHEIKSGSSTGQIIEKNIKNGELVSSELVLSLLKKAMEEHINLSICKGILLDGFPREIEQAKLFEITVAECSMVLYFEISDETMMKRLMKRGETSGRVDDNEETIKKRIQNFHWKTEPVLEFYQEKTVKKSAEENPDDLFIEVEKVLDQFIVNFEVRKIQKELFPDPIDISPLRKEHHLVFFVIGGPGSGKRTQCALLARKYNFSHISIGDLLREEICFGSPRAQYLEEKVTGGQNIPHEIVLHILKETMLCQLSFTKGFILDGFPEDVDQAKMFESEVVEGSIIIYFKVSEETMKTRLKKKSKESGRTYENETTEKSIEGFQKQILSILNYFGTKVKIVLAETTPEIVFFELCKIFDEIANRDSLIHS
ncbi:adenylate kinase isoenzyme 5-like [Limulus polyphemus]|uniref:Adenylate kinase isoenzyme 5-like n=1 Tax=Limulus polyphemus TaxID=6850 RepID=A0ABM1BPR0_LIMPO|nr:adenylate kinase isoenzyme 5-like [Limulus polyphemus]